MAGNILWQSGVVQWLAMQASGQGQLLNSGVAVATTNDLYNTGESGGPALYATAELYASASGWGGAISAGNTMDFYLVPYFSGTMDVDVAGGVLPANSLKGYFRVTTSGNSHAHLAIENIPLMPMRYKGYVRNSLLQTMTSGWTLNIGLYNEAYT